jgi:hypothetical protein
MKTFFAMSIVQSAIERYNASMPTLLLHLKTIKKALGLWAMVCLTACGGTSNPDPDPDPDPDPNAFEIAFPSETIIATHINGTYCYAKEDQMPVCHGNDDSGQLGNGSGASETEHIQLPTEVDYFAQIFVGFRHVCGLSDRGQVYCWGDNSVGQLGVSTSTTQSSVPVAIDRPDSVKHFTQIKVGYNHACALADTKDLYCWGQGDSGQMGNGQTEMINDSLQKVDTPDGQTWKNIYPGQGEFACAGTESDRTFCWGSNDQRPIINGGLLTYSIPQEIEYPTESDEDLLLTNIQSGLYHSCGQHEPTGYHYCWGDNGLGQLATGDISSTYINEIAGGDPDPLYERIFVGDQSTCMIWGDFPSSFEYEDDFRCYFPVEDDDGPGIIDADPSDYENIDGNRVKNFLPGRPSIGRFQNNEIFIFESLSSRNAEDSTGNIIETTTTPVATYTWETF